MCEQHSVYSDKQAERKAQGIRKRRMDPQLGEQLVRELAPHGLREVIPSTMGEPLMYQHFDRVVDAIKSQPGLRMNLTTNGSFHPGPHGRSAEEWARMLLPHISDVKISWNGASAAVQEGIMRGSKWDKQLANLGTLLRVRDEIAAAGRNRASITLQLTFMTTNIKEIPKVVAMGIALGVDRIKGHHLWAHFKEIKGHDLRSTPETVKAWNECVEQCLALARSKVLPNGQHIKLEHFEPLAVQAQGQGGHSSKIDEDAECPFLGKEAWVNHAGEFAPCCAPDEQRRSLGSFGSVAGPGGLMAVWTSPQYRDLVRNYKSKALCQGCHMRKKPAAIASGQMGAP